MSRRSARLRGQKRKFEEITERELAETLNKRLKNNEEEAVKMDAKQRQHHVLHQNHWAPLPQQAVPVAVPAAVPAHNRVSRRKSSAGLLRSRQRQQKSAALRASASTGCLPAAPTHAARSHAPAPQQQLSACPETCEISEHSSTTSPFKKYQPNTTSQFKQQTLTMCSFTSEKSHKPSITSPYTVETSQQPGTMSSLRLRTMFTTPTQLRDSPLPSFRWADSRLVWENLLRKEEMYCRKAAVLERHPALQARMRSILLDWLVEVCEVYRLHRETFHLAVDLIDRYLCVSRDIQKSQLQLLGITALFVAAKIEEIYPPKLSEFAYVTDGACTDSEILDQELVMLKSLKWELCPMTVNSWLNIFLQLVNVEGLEERDMGFLKPQYSQHAFINIARLLDLCTLDLGSLRFPYSVLATAATYHLSTEHVALAVSGYSWQEIAPCVHWMAPYALTLREAGVLDLKYFQNIAPDDVHNIQTHAVDLALLEKAQEKSVAVQKSSRASPELSRQNPTFMTPPQT